MQPAEPLTPSIYLAIRCWGVWQRSIAYSDRSRQKNLNGSSYVVRRFTQIFILPDLNQKGPNRKSKGPFIQRQRLPRVVNAIRGFCPLEVRMVMVMVYAIVW